MAGPRRAASGHDRIAERFVEWARTEDAIRAAFIIGSRAREDHAADEWADLDILAITSEASGHLRSSDWVSLIGDPWITFIEPAPAGHGTERRVLFAGGVDVDFALFTVGEIEAMLTFDPRTAGTAFGRGFRVLLDKDGLVARWFDGVNPPAHVEPAPLPDAGGFEQVVCDFWYHAVWTAKHLRRGELWWAKLGCDSRMKDRLRQVLEWEAAAAGRDPWFRGRFFEEWADPVILRDLRTAFARYDVEEVWAALTATMDLFGEVSRRTAVALGVPCPPAVEQHARDLVAQLHSTRPAAMAVRHG